MVLGRRFAQRDLQASSRCRQRRRIIPLQVVSSPVMQINRFPVWVIARIKRAPLGVELVAKHKIPFGSVVDGGARVGLGRSVFVDQPKAANHFRYLCAHVYSFEPERQGNNGVPVQSR